MLSQVEVFGKPVFTEERGGRGGEAIRWVCSSSWSTAAPLAPTPATTAIIYAVVADLTLVTTDPSYLTAPTPTPATDPTSGAPASTSATALTPSSPQESWLWVEIQPRKEAAGGGGAELWQTHFLLQGLTQKQIGPGERQKLD